MKKGKTKLNQSFISEEFIELIEGWQHDDNSLINEYQKQLIELSDEILVGSPDVGKLDTLYLLYRMRSLLECLKA